MNRMNSLLIFVLLLNCFNGIYSNLTLEEITQFAANIRSQCQAQTGVEEDLIDGINAGEFPRDPALMCYLNCMLSSFRMLRKGKLNAPLAIKQVNTFLPEFMRDEWLKGIEACKDHAIDVADQCERVFLMVQCFYKNNQHFMLP